MGLAPLIVAQIFDIIREINAQGADGAAGGAERRAGAEAGDRGYVLETGEIVLPGSAAELLADERVRAAYLGEGEAAS